MWRKLKGPHLTQIRPIRMVGKSESHSSLILTARPAESAFNRMIHKGKGNALWGYHWVTSR